jgi:hypothetical protein
MGTKSDTTSAKAEDDFTRISEGHFLFQGKGGQANRSLARLGDEGRLLRLHILHQRNMEHL